MLRAARETFEETSPDFGLFRTIGKIPVMESQNGLGWKRPQRLSSSNSLCHGQGTLHLDQAAQSPTQPGPDEGVHSGEEEPRQLPHSLLPSHCCSHCTPLSASPVQPSSSPPLPCVLLLTKGLRLELHHCTDTCSAPVLGPPSPA